MLDRELCEVAGMVRRLPSFGPRVVKQLRVDGVVAQIPRREQARFLALNAETWPCGLRTYKAEKLPPHSPTIVTVGCFSPVTEAGKPPSPPGPWEYLSQAAAEEHMRAGGSI